LSGLVEARLEEDNRMHGLRLADVIALSAVAESGVGNAELFSSELGTSLERGRVQVKRLRVRGLCEPTPDDAERIKLTWLGHRVLRDATATIEAELVEHLPMIARQLDLSPLGEDSRAVTSGASRAS
jgi:hypothetical protein